MENPVDSKCQLYIDSLNFKLEAFSLLPISQKFKVLLIFYHTPIYSLKFYSMNHVYFKSMKVIKIKFLI